MTKRSVLNDEKCADLYSRGYSSRIIAQMYGVSVSSVLRALVRAGVDKPHGAGRPPAHEQPNRYRKYYLPRQLAAARNKVAALEAEAKRYGLLVEARP